MRPSLLLAFLTCCATSPTDDTASIEDEGGVQVNDADPPRDGSDASRASNAADASRTSDAADASRPGDGGRDSTPAPTCSDGMMNQGESDVDCGGPCTKCTVGKACGQPGDCASGNCSSKLCCTPSSRTLTTGPISGDVQLCCAAG